MLELFSEEWAEAYMNAWNTDKEIISTLEDAGFSSVVAFGFQDEDEARFVMVIDKGKITSVGSKNAVNANWDLRATPENWRSLTAKPPGLMQLGMAYTSRKLRFLKGDYATMIKDPNLAGAFVRSFALMGKVV